MKIMCFVEREEIFSIIGVDDSLHGQKQMFILHVRSPTIPLSLSLSLPYIPLHRHTIAYENLGMNTQPPRMSGTLNISVLPIILSSRLIIHITKEFGDGTISLIKWCW
jgi:hypothetical protein